MKLLIDMNLSPRWREVLQAAGHQVNHWLEVGQPNASDHEIMEFAKQHGQVVLTHDLDFGAILAATGGTGPSVVQLRAGDTSPEANGRAMVGALAQCEQDLAVGALLTVDVARVRLTILPLARHDG